MMFLTCFFFFGWRACWRRWWCADNLNQFRVRDTGERVSLIGRICVYVDVRELHELFWGKTVVSTTTSTPTTTNTLTPRNATTTRTNQPTVVVTCSTLYDRRRHKTRTNKNNKTHARAWQLAMCVSLSPSCCFCVCVLLVVGWCVC